MVTGNWSMDRRIRPIHASSSRSSRTSATSWKILFCFIQKYKSTTKVSPIHSSKLNFAMTFVVLSDNSRLAIPINEALMIRLEIAWSFFDFLEESISESSSMLMPSQTPSEARIRYSSLELSSCLEVVGVERTPTEVAQVSPTQSHFKLIQVG